MGREALQRAGLTVKDAQFISQATAGRLPALVTGNIDGVALHPEDMYLAMQQKPGTTRARSSYPTSCRTSSSTSTAPTTDWMARDPALLRDTIAAMIEANRAIYADKDKVVPIMVEGDREAEGGGRPRLGRRHQELRLGQSTRASAAKRTQWTID